MVMVDKIPARDHFSGNTDAICTAKIESLLHKKAQKTGSCFLVSRSMILRFSVYLEQIFSLHTSVNVFSPTDTNILFAFN